jgi:hypothetical protein
MSDLPNPQFENEGESITSLSGPVEMIDGKLTLRIPLSADCAGLIDCSRGIGMVDGNLLQIALPPWLVEKLSISEGSIVTVDNANGRFNITPK